MITEGVALSSVPLYMSKAYYEIAYAADDHAPCQYVMWYTDSVKNLQRALKINIGGVFGQQIREAVIQY